MVIFKDLVNLVLEANTPGTPDWFDKVLDKHQNLSNNAQITETDLEKIFFPLLGNSNISEQSFLNIYKFKRILDFLQTLYDGMPAQKPKDWNSFKTNLRQTQIENIGNSYNSRIQTINNNISDWEILNDKILKLEQSTKKVIDSKSEIALSTYANMSVIEAVQAMVNQRVDFFTRVVKLKSPTSPFTNLIKDVFSYPEDYLSGTKKYTSDFEGIDNFYISNLIDIALAAKNFFVSELAKLKLSQIQTSGLNLFDIIVGQILNEQPTSFRGGTATTSGGLFVPSGFNNQQQQQQQQNTPTTQTPTIDPNIVKMVRNEIATNIPARIDFLSGKPVIYKLVDETTGKEKVPEVSKTLDSKNYSVGQIMELAKRGGSENQEAVNLLSALKAVSQNTKKRTGAGERLKYATQAASSLAGFAGAKLYG